MQTQEIKRGQIYLVNLPQTNNSIQGGGIRPVVIVSNSMACKYSPVLHVVPITSRIKRWMPTHVEITMSSGLIKTSTALVEQIQLLPKDAIIKCVGRCNDYILGRIDRAIGIQFGLVEACNKEVM